MTEIHHDVLLQDLAVVMIVAGLVTLVFHRLRQPVVLGYILAGLIIGPHLFEGLALINRASIETLAELGVVFIMFSLGMDFSLRTLRRIGSTAFIGASVEIVGMIWIGYQLGLLFGWSRMDSLFLGAILSISSTTITVKVLSEMGLIKERFAEMALGILIVEDILAIALIAFLSGVAVTGELAVGAVMVTLGKVLAFLCTVLVVGFILVPRLIRYVAQYKSAEMMLVTVLGLCFGVSLLTVKLGYSVALGAFLIGTIIGEAREIGQIKLLTEPVRDMFSAVFFVSIGMLIEPRLLTQFAGPIVIITLAMIVGKIVTRSLAVLATGHSTRTSLRVAMTLAQIGEFSFIIAALGVSLKVTSNFLYPIAVCVSVITTLSTPYLVRASDGVVDRFDRLAPQWLVGLLELYSGWLERVRRSRADSMARRLVHRWAWQIAINLVLVSGAFLAAVGLAPWAVNRWPDLPEAIGGAKGAVWLAAMLVTLPALIAALRKLQALAMLLSEMSVPAVRGEAITVSRAIVRRTIFVAGALGVGLLVAVLSSTLLPRGPSLVALLLMASLVTILLWRFFIQVHARAQIAMLETLAETPPAPNGTAAEPLPLILREARLETVPIPEGSPAAGKLIRELELRTRTGASAVGIERGASPIINPGPDEELQAGDKVLLLGNTEQLTVARLLLAGGTSTEE